MIEESHKRFMVVALAVLWTPVTDAAASDIELIVPPDLPPQQALTREHPARGTGWARTFLNGQPLRAEAAGNAPKTGTSPSRRSAARIKGLSWDAQGRIWLNLAYPNGTRGWVNADRLRSVPPVMPLSVGLRRSLRAIHAKTGASSSAVVRDRFGPTLFRAGTGRPLTLASVTKVFTVGAALDLVKRPRWPATFSRPRTTAKRNGSSSAWAAGTTPAARVGPSGMPRRLGPTWLWPTARGSIHEIARRRTTW